MHRYPRLDRLTCSSQRRLKIRSTLYSPRPRRPRYPPGGRLSTPPPGRRRRKTTFISARPIAADEVNWPLADYRYGGVFLPNVVHTGIDIPSPTGTPVLAAGSGRVVWAGYGLFMGSEDFTDPYGLSVAIKHDFGYQGENLFTIYGHISRMDVARGQQVEAGDVLGLSGETGKVTGPHLHFEVRIGRNTFSRSRNPELWLAPPQGWGILAGHIMGTSGAKMVSQPVTIRSKESGNVCGRWFLPLTG